MFGAVVVALGLDYARRRGAGVNLGTAAIIGVGSVVGVAAVFSVVGEGEGVSLTVGEEATFSEAGAVCVEAGVALGVAPSEAGRSVGASESQAKRGPAESTQGRKLSVEVGGAFRHFVTP